MWRRVGQVALGWLVAVAGLAGNAPMPVSQAVGVTTASVAYKVTLSQDAVLPGHQYTVRGVQYRSGAQSKTVVLLLHGLSYGKWAWDFPAASDNSNPYKYQLARYLAASGYDAVAVDELGYGSSDHPSGLDVHQLTIPAYANMAHQIVSTLHAGYQKVVIAGHSAGGEISNFEAGRYRDVNGLADIDMCDVGASAEVIKDIFINDTLGGLKPYGYFGGTVAERTRLMYNAADADPAIINIDNGLAEPTPTAEMQSISPQPAKAVDPLVNAPVLVAFGSKDLIFPSTCQPFQAPLYLLSPKVSKFELVGAGHTIFLHRNADLFEVGLVNWLGTISSPGP